MVFPHTKCSYDLIFTIVRDLTSPVCSISWYQKYRKQVGSCRKEILPYLHKFPSHSPSLHTKSHVGLVIVVTSPLHLSGNVNHFNLSCFLESLYCCQAANILGILSWDDWVPQDRIRKNSEENKELATNLKLEMDKLLKPAKATAPSSKKKAAGSDLSSARGSEERQTPAMGRGQKRGRDFDIEKVRSTISSKKVTSAPCDRTILAIPGDLPAACIARHE